MILEEASLLERADFIVVLSYLFLALHVLFIVIEDILPSVARVKCLNVKLMAIDVLHLFFFTGTL